MFRFLLFRSKGVVKRANVRRGDALTSRLSPFNVPVAAGGCAFDGSVSTVTNGSSAAGPPLLPFFSPPRQLRWFSSSGGGDSGGDGNGNGDGDGEVSVGDDGAAADGLLGDGEGAGKDEGKVAIRSAAVLAPGSDLTPSVLLEAFKNIMIEVEDPSSATMKVKMDISKSVVPIMDAKGDLTGEVKISFPNPSERDDFYDDLHGVKHANGRLALKKEGVVNKFDQGVVSKEDFAEHVIETYLEEKKDQIDDYDFDAEKDFSQWVDAYMKKYRGVLVADGVLTEDQADKMQSGDVNFGEDSSDGWGAEDDVEGLEDAAATTEFDHLRAMDEMTLQGRYSDKLSSEDQKEYDRMMEAWNEVDDEVLYGADADASSQSKRSDEDVAALSASKARNRAYDEAYLKFMQRVRKEEEEEQDAEGSGGRSLSRSSPDEDLGDGEMQDEGEDANTFDPPPSGEWAETIVKVDRVQKVTRGGVIMKFRSLIVTGNNKGACGYGVGKGQSPREALLIASRDSKKNLVIVDRYEDQALCNDVIGVHNGCKVVIRAVPPGYGMKAGRLVREILLQCGISDASAKAYGNRNPFSVVRATFKALKSHDGIEAIARKRGKRIMSMRKAMKLNLS